MRPKQGLIKKTGKALKKASPTILSILGVVGVVTTAVLAVKATPKALEHIEDAKEAKNLENGEDLTRMETIAACWRCYIPATATGIATVGCILGANVLNRRQQASLASAYALLNRTYQDYRKSVKNVFGEEGHKRVLQDMAVERVPEEHTIYTQGTFSSTTLDFCVPEEEHLFYRTEAARLDQLEPMLRKTERMALILPLWRERCRNPPAAGVPALRR